MLLLSHYLISNRPSPGLATCWRAENFCLIRYLSTVAGWYWLLPDRKFTPVPVPQGGTGCCLPEDLLQVRYLGTGCCPASKLILIRYLSDLKARHENLKHQNIWQPLRQLSRLGLQGKIRPNGF